MTGGAAADVPLDYSALPDRLLVPKGAPAALSAVVELPESAAAPLDKGGEVGRVTMQAGGAKVGSWPVYAGAGAARMDFDAGGAPDAREPAVKREKPPCRPSRQGSGHLNDQNLQSGPDGPC